MLQYEPLVKRFSITLKLIKVSHERGKKTSFYKAYLDAAKPIVVQLLDLLKTFVGFFYFSTFIFLLIGFCLNFISIFDFIVKRNF